jgi:hypothetical protein
MKVRITESLVWGFRAYLPGDEIEMPDASGVEMLRRGVAERLEDVPETAALNRGERAARVTRPVR